MTIHPYHCIRLAHAELEDQNCGAVLSIPEWDFILVPDRFAPGWFAWSQLLYDRGLNPHCPTHILRDYGARCVYVEGVALPWIAGSPGAIPWRPEKIE